MKATVTYYTKTSKEIEIDDKYNFYFTTDEEDWTPEQSDLFYNEFNHDVENAILKKDWDYLELMGFDVE